MKVVIAGGSGFLGAPLAEAYAEESHDVRVLTRALAPGESRHDPGTGVPGITRVGWSADGASGPWAAVLEGADAAINLSGESIDRGRWTPQRKARIRDSRILATRSLATAILAAASPPAVFVSGSAVGYYGDAGSQPVTESSPGRAGTFSHRPAPTGRPKHTGPMRPASVWAVVRTGVVLESSGGALPRMILPYRFFVGGPLGQRPARRLVGPPAGLDGDCSLDCADRGRPRAGQRDGAAPGHQPRALDGDRPRRAPSEPRAGSRLRPADRRGRDGRFAAHRSAGHPERALALGYHFRYPDIGQAMQGHLRRVGRRCYRGVAEEHAPKEAVATGVTSAADERRPALKGEKSRGKASEQLRNAGAPPRKSPPSTVVESRRASCR